jgi:hypothetical protein
MNSTINRIEDLPVIDLAEYMAKGSESCKDLCT